MVSIIAKFRTGRRVAQEQAQPSTKDQATPSASSTPYRHIPTHAAMDAMAGSPTCYREQDRQKIREQHRRRSARNVAAMSEKTSSVGATRPNSYAGYNTEQFYGRASTIDRAQSGQKTRMRPERYDSGIKRSPLSSVEVSPHISVANSTTSEKSSTSSLASVQEEPVSRITQEPKSSTLSNASPSKNVTQVRAVPVSEETGTEERLNEPNESFWSAPRQLTSSTPYTSTVITTTAQAETEKRKMWRFGRKPKAQAT